MEMEDPDLKFLLCQDSFLDNDKRAWTLQEAVLSTRLLVFNGHYVAFFCCGGATREDLSSIDSQEFVGEKKKTSMTNWVLDFASSMTIDLLSGFRMSSYRELVKLYTSRKMANPMDALNAISGLLAYWRNITQTEFVMGHPTEFLSDSLIWVGKNYHHRGHPGIPSWSWAAWEGNVAYSYEIENKLQGCMIIPIRLRKHANTILTTGSWSVANCSSGDTWQRLAWKGATAMR